MKNRQVFTYTDITKLCDASYWDTIKGIPIITVTADLRKGFIGNPEIDKTMGLFAKDKNCKVCEFRRLAEFLIPGWADDETKFKQTIALSQFLRIKLSETTDEQERKWLVGCRRNITSLLSAIIMLEEADISISDLEDERDSNIQLLLEAWKYLKKHDTAIHEFHDSIAELQNRESMQSLLCLLFDKPTIDSVIIFGFFYFTPLQQRIIDLIESAGIKTIYLFHYDERYPYANEVWIKTYSEENGYPSIEKWIKENAYDPNPFGEILEGNIARCAGVKIKENGSIAEFIQYIKRAKENGQFIYSANQKTANDILRDFYPEEYGDRKLLSYPIGQFVSIINDLWDEERNCVILNQDSVIECFSSGWLSIGGESGKQYIEDVVNLMPFFSDCQKLVDWKNRINLIKRIKNEVIHPFINETSLDEVTLRWQRIMGNPFLNFSFFSVPDDRIDIVLQLISQIVIIAEDLYKSGNMISIPDHIRKLDALLRKHEISDDIFVEEQDIIIDIMERLSKSSGFLAECSPADISAAIKMFMSGKYNDYEIQSDRIGLVSPIYQIDAAPLRHSKIHICLCDVKSMPGANKPYVWPLTGKIIKNCYNKTHNKLIRNLIYIMESTCICNRYFMYSGLSNSDVEISWLSDNGDKKLAPSSYIKMLTKFGGVDVIPSDSTEISYSYVEAVESGSKKIAEYDLRKMPISTSKEAKMDYALCPMKYVFGYVLDEQPSFSSIFHQNYAINALIMAVISLLGVESISSEEVFSKVISLFPALRDAEKRQIHDYINENDDSIKDTRFHGYSDFEGMLYTEERLKVRFPDKKMLNEAYSAYGKLLTPEGQKDMDIYRKNDQSDSAVSKNRIKLPCQFCQHQTYCRLAEFGENQEN